MAMLATCAMVARAQNPFGADEGQGLGFGSNGGPSQGDSGGQQGAVADFGIGLGENGASTTVEDGGQRGDERAAMLCN